MRKSARRDNVVVYSASVTPSGYRLVSGPALRTRSIMPDIKGPVNLDSCFLIAGPNLGAQTWGDDGNAAISSLIRPGFIFPRREYLLGVGGIVKPRGADWEGCCERYLVS